MKLNVLAASVAAAASLMFAGAAQSAIFILDDWQINAGSGNFVNAAGPGTSDGPTARTATGGTSLTRANIFTTVTSGGSAGQNTLGDCDSCNFGTFSNDVGTAGWGYWSWTGGGDLSAFSKVGFEYFADLPNADIIVAFFGGGALAASAQKSEMAATGGVPTPFELSIDMSGATSIDEVRLYVFSEGGDIDTDSLLGTINAGEAQPIGLDFGVRGLEVRTEIPEPSSLALLGLSLAGLGFMRRRRA